ncbi:hypothetical protein Ahy_A09g046327 [Arachis hypogaea]|uniref:BHLH domain-containing protein n=1 Tax=Arachis hypogaea TaxID=3818 RepID=A0A445BPG6_ARAHY|nr:hypothetical protein Ahy_A09g046327 [Arachis hypogaea]
MALHDIDAAVESFKNALVLEPNDENFGQPKPKFEVKKDKKLRTLSATDIEEESVGVKKACPTRGVKRSRSAEVHNLSERRRRDRINEKMRALQDLIPYCNKVYSFIFTFVMFACLYFQTLSHICFSLSRKCNQRNREMKQRGRKHGKYMGLCAVGQCMHEKAKIFSNLLSPPTRASSRPKAMIAMSIGLIEIP